MQKIVWVEVRPAIICFRHIIVDWLTAKNERGNSVTVYITAEAADIVGHSSGRTNAVIRMPGP